MVPAGKPVDDNLDLLLSLLNKDDIIIDGGNSYLERYPACVLKRRLGRDIHYLDCGTSGGVWGLQNGYCLMYGGNAGSRSLC